MSASIRTTSALKAAGGSNPGLLREVNEDRFHFDVSRGLFLVIDGVGGQAAGGKAADIALSMLRRRLERETGTVPDRVREAIAIANNEIHRVARLRPEWDGMACVLTVLVVDETHAIVGHVGDTRLYKLRGDRIEKMTCDHSPVGEREDSNEISELEAMRHPRRNEVYRDVGSELHQPDDSEFVDVLDIPFESDAALLLCSDGLSDLLESASIQQIVQQLAGQPQRVVNALIEAANTAGGKDNISVVYVEGERFAPTEPNGQDVEGHTTTRQRIVQYATVALLIAVIGLALARLRPSLLTPEAGAPAPGVSRAQSIVVLPGASISSAVSQAEPGSQVIVEPGEYRETLVLKSRVRVVSRIPRGATIRLPGTASEADAAVVADGIVEAELVGFRIVGDAATPLGTGVLVNNSDVSLVDLDVAGAANVAIDISAPSSRGSVVASDIHDNPGAALAIRSEA